MTELTKDGRLVFVDNKDAKAIFQIIQGCTVLKIDSVQGRMVDLVDYISSSLDAAGGAPVEDFYMEFNRLFKGADRELAVLQLINHLADYQGSIRNKIDGLKTIRENLGEEVPFLSAVELPSVSSVFGPCTCDTCSKERELLTPNKN